MTGVYSVAVCPNHISVHKGKAISKTGKHPGISTHSARELKIQEGESGTDNMRLWELNMENQHHGEGKGEEQQ
jgi:hypothetical protein